MPACSEVSSNVLGRRHPRLSQLHGLHFSLHTPHISHCQISATEHFGQPDWLSEFQEASNFFFVVLFTFEMLFKMYALGLSFYFIPLFNRFDFFVVLTSILEMTLTMANVIPPVGMSVLRCIRLLRAFKVVVEISQPKNSNPDLQVTRYWKSLQNLLKSLISSIEAIASLLVLLFLFLGIFALLGTQVCIHIFFRILTK